MTKIGRALLLAGGLGTRLGPLGELDPKPLVPLDRNWRIIDQSLDQLRRAGVQRVTLALWHRAECVMDALGDGSRHDLAIDYIVERHPLGTAGSLALFDHGGVASYVANCDVLTDLDLIDLARSHHRDDNAVTIAAQRTVERSPFAVLELADHGAAPRQIVRFDEKPAIERLVNMGIYVVEPGAIALIGPDEHIDMDTFVHRLLADGQRVGACVHDGAWADVGTPAAVHTARAARRTSTERKVA